MASQIYCACLLQQTMDSTMKLKESQLIILTVLPIYMKTEQSEVANAQISSESYATGKNIPETKKVSNPT